MTLRFSLAAILCVCASYAQMPNLDLQTIATFRTPLDSGASTPSAQLSPLIPGVAVGMNGDGKLGFQPTGPLGALFRWC
jgi:hypothetical protein